MFHMFTLSVPWYCHLRVFVAVFIVQRHTRFFCLRNAHQRKNYPRVNK